MKGGENMNIKKFLVGASLASLILLAFTFNSGSVRADNKNDDRPENRHEERNNNDNFNADKELTRAKCSATGDPVINVVQKVKNDVDSGFGSNAYFPTESNYWNVESYTRHIKVWSTGTDTWCATVAYDGGRFNAFYHQTGPGGTGLIGPDVDGKMQGGYRATFTGVLAPTDWPTNGNVGTFDYNCDLHAVCPGRVDWVAKYFSGYTAFDQPWWGWIYKAGSHGTWINAIDVLPAASGNIL